MSLFVGREKQDNIRIRSTPDGSRFVFVSDMQVPLEDRKLLRTIFDDFVPDFEPAKDAEYHLFIGGDGLDNFTLSRFLPRVLARFTLADEIKMMRRYLAQWAHQFDGRHYIFGNHEDRWERELYEGNPQLVQFARTLPEVLELDELGYDWVPYLKHYDFEGLILTHGDTAVMHAAKKMMDNYHASGVSGHTNRPQSFTWAAAAGGEPITWYVSGMLCRRDIGSIIKDWRRIQPWMQGFVIGEVRKGVAHVELVRVHHGGFWAAGKWYKVG